MNCPLNTLGRTYLKVLAIIACFPLIIVCEAAMPEPRTCPDRQGTCVMTGTRFCWRLLTPGQGKLILEPAHPCRAEPGSFHRAVPGLMPPQPWGTAALTTPTALPDGCPWAGSPALAGPDPIPCWRGHKLPPAPAPPLAFPSATPASRD